MIRHDRVYHGIKIDPDDETRAHRPAKIYVETPKGSSHRRLGQLQLADKFGDHFAWGYDGDGPARAAHAILSDALELSDPRINSMGIGKCGRLVLLREDFMFDFLEEACNEWRLSRPMILRWARAWYVQRGIDDLPESLNALPAFLAN